ARVPDVEGASEVKPVQVERGSCDGAGGAICSRLDTSPHLEIQILVPLHPGHGRRDGGKERITCALDREVDVPRFGEFNSGLNGPLAALVAEVLAAEPD